MRKVILVFILTLAHTVSSVANNQLCAVKPPIDTVEKAWCVIEKVLILQSCFSAAGYSREAKDLGKSWLLRITDKNTDKNSACRTTVVEVCKTDGKIIFDRDNEKCSP